MRGAWPMMGPTSPSSDSAGQRSLTGSAKHSAATRRSTVQSGRGGSGGAGRHSESPEFWCGSTPAHPYVLAHVGDADGVRSERISLKQLLDVVRLEGFR